MLWPFLNCVIRAFATRAVPEVQGDEFPLEILGVKDVVEHSFGGNISSQFPKKIGLHACHRKLHAQHFTARNKFWHLPLDCPHRNDLQFKFLARLKNIIVSVILAK